MGIRCRCSRDLDESPSSLSLSLLIQKWGESTSFRGGPGEPLRLEHLPGACLRCPGQRRGDRCRAPREGTLAVCTVHPGCALRPHHGEGVGCALSSVRLCHLSPCISPGGQGRFPFSPLYCYGFLCCVPSAVNVFRCRRKDMVFLERWVGILGGASGRCHRGC